MIGKFQSDSNRWVTDTVSLSKKQKRKRLLPPRVKRMERPARLQAARMWLTQFDGKNVLRGYCKHFAVDWRCAAIELRTLGLCIDDSYLEQRELAEKAMVAKRKAKEEMRETADAAAFSGEFYEYVLQEELLPFARDEHQVDSTIIRCCCSPKTAARSRVRF